jgi:hypothetical protein
MRKGMKKTFKIGPIILITLGIIFLLNNFGILPWDIWTNLWKFWPVIIILIGIEILIGQSISIRTMVILLVLVFLIPIFIAVNPLTRNPLETQTVPISEPAASITRAKIIIDLPAVTLNLKAASSNSEKIIDGKISFSKAASEPKITKEEDFNQAIFTINQDQQKSPLPFISSLKNDAELNLTQSIPLEILFKTGASSANLDLNNLRVDYLEIDSKASNLKISFGNQYSSRAVLKTGASNIEIQIPKNLATKITVDSKIKNLSIDSRFKKDGGEYKTSDFDKSFTKLEIEISAIAGSITIK